MNILDASAVNVALPVILTDFGTGTGAGVWVVLAYSAMLASTVLLFGQLSDRLGPQRLLSGGFLAFTVASLACGLASTMEALVVARLFQGIAGGALSATSMAVVGRYVPPEERGRAIGLLSAAAALGSLLGSPVGGLLSATVGWRWVFFINVPVGFVACLALLLNRMPEVAAEGDWRPDILGAVLSMAGITGFIYAVSASSDSGQDSMVVGVLSVVTLLAFLAWERRCPHPLLNLELLALARFRDANSANFFASGFVAGTMFLLPFYLRYVQGLSQAATGLALLVLGAVYVFVSPQAGRLADRWGGTSLSTAAALAGALVMMVFALSAGHRGLPGPILAMAFIGLCYGLYLTPNNRRILSLAPSERQGAASGTLRLLYYLGQAMGVAAIESLFSALVPGGGTEVAKVEASRLVPAFQAGLAACGVLMVICAVFSYRSGRPEPTRGS
jgi:EmrB/QacA subfamily drug resistance transporter